MFLNNAAENDATAHIYKSDLDDMGFIMNLSRLWAWRADVCESFSSLRSNLMSGSSLSTRELSVLVCTTAASLGDSYCALAWGNKLASLAGPSTAAAVLQKLPADSMTPRELALQAWAQKVAGSPNNTTAQDIYDLQAVGISDREIFEATAYVAFRYAFSTINNALGVRPDWQLASNGFPEVVAAITY